MSIGELLNPFKNHVLNRERLKSYQKVVLKFSHSKKSNINECRRLALKRLTANPMREMN